MSKNKHPHRPARRKALLPALAIALLACLAALLWAFSDPFPRLQISGFRVTREEYLRAMYQARNDVLSDHAAAGISLKDWSAETALGNPRQLAVDRTLEILSEYYAVSTLAVERGYLADAGYEAMTEDMEGNNRRRQETLDSGGMVTGIPVFTVDSYITYRAMNLKLQFCSDPANPEYAVTEEDIRQRYKADRDSLYLQPDSMELSFLLADGAGEELEADFQRALETGDLALALEEMPHLKPYYQEVSVTPETYGVYARSHGDVLAWASGLSAGEFSPVLREEDRLCLILCAQRTDAQYTPLEEVESLVVQSIRESRYDALIAARTEAADIRGDLNALYRFTAEQLP